MLRVLTGALLAALCLPATAQADFNPTPIALPLLGTSGVGSPYPSRLTITPADGPAQTGTPRIRLHGVTHACPEDSVVLLVHDGVGYLLLSGAGGCRPFAGTTLVFEPGTGTALPDSDAGAPHGAYESLTPSVYGAQPTLPAPAPPGPYQAVLPPASTMLTGNWDLYIWDRAADRRGVVAGGWSLFPSTLLTRDVNGPIAIPAAGALAPIEFDFSPARPDRQVHSVILFLTLTHTNPDDLEIVLQSPAGTTAVVMADALGVNDLNGSQLLFLDSGISLPPDEALTFPTLFKPGASYGTLQLTTPPGPHGTAFAAFANEPLTGMWRLWINDDAAPNSGTVHQARLQLGTERRSLPIAIETPTAALTFDATQAFVDVGTVVPDIDGTFTATWRNVVNGGHYASGPMRITPATGAIDATIPLKRGSNIINVVLDSGGGNYGTFVQDTLFVNVQSFDYYLSEGATGAFFDTDIGLFNAAAVPAPVELRFLPESGAPIVESLTLGAAGATVVHADSVVPPGGFSTVVRSTDAVPLAIERTMYWDATRYGGHGGTAVDGASTRWLFAEGAQGFFDTYVLLANDNASAVTATVRFLRETGGPVVITPSLPAHSRTTIWAGAVAGLPGASFGIEVTAPSPIIAERAMYFPHGAGHVFEGGTGAAGVTHGSQTWFLAEGATGPFFECFLLVSNPDAVAASVTFTYLLPSGATLTRTAVVPANGRLTINVEGVDPQLADTPVSTTVTSDRAIVVERAMYWPDFSVGWQEAHDSFGVTAPGLRWGVGNGMVGTAQGFETYVLLANPNAVPAEVEVVFVKADSPTAPIVKSYTLAPTSRRNVAVSVDVPELGAGAFGVEVRVVNYQPIVVEKAMYWNADGVTWAGGSGVTGSRLPPP